jgi:ribose transport system ATP-binding protein
MGSDNETVVLLVHISKQFSGVYALNDVTFDLKKEIHSIVGHNGAGKSTLVKILMGALQPDGGKILLNGKQVSFSSPRDAQNSRIAMVWQELNNFPNLTVTENLLINRFVRRKNGAIDWKASHEQCREYLKRLNLDINPKERMGNLPLSVQQLAEFAKALSFDPSVLILDEPTSALSIREQKILHEKIRMIKEQGVAIVFISHKLDEVLELSDRITIMRDGKRILTKDASELDKDQIVSGIVGKSEGLQSLETIGACDQKCQDSRSVILKVENLSLHHILSDVSFELHQGEILGLTGVSGSGISEVGQILFGIEQEYTGAIWFNEKRYRAASPLQAVRKGFGYVPKDRKEEGIIPQLSVGDNIVLSSLPNISKAGFVNFKKRAAIIKDIMETIDLVPRNPEIRIGSLCGVNQQKGIMARWISKDSQVLILDEPTRGVDVGAIHKIYSLIRQMANNGLSVIVISSEFEEVHAAAERMLILNKGRLVGELETGKSYWEDAFAMAVK